LLDDPICCNDDGEVTWIKIVSQDLTVQDKVKHFMHLMKRRKEEIGGAKVLKIRKLLSNVYFQD
jgi:hypothetical protein